MKSLLASKRSKAILGIGIVALSIGAISKKVISYPAGGCIKGGQEMTFNSDKYILNKPWISWTLDKTIYMPYQTIPINSLHSLDYRESTGKASLGYFILEKL